MFSHVYKPKVSIQSITSFFRISYFPPYWTPFQSLKGFFEGVVGVIKEIKYYGWRKELNKFGHFFILNPLETGHCTWKIPFMIFICLLMKYYSISPSHWERFISGKSILWSFPQDRIFCCSMTGLCASCSSPTLIHFPHSNYPFSFPKKLQNLISFKKVLL